MGWFAAFFAGIVLGLLGAGGGILTVPILVSFFAVSATAATGNSLFIVGLISLVGAVQGMAKKECDYSKALLLALPSMIGAFVSRSVFLPNLPDPIFGASKDQALLFAYALLMAVVGIRMLKGDTRSNSRPQSHLLIASFGLGIGLVSGTLGAGGGFLILPVLTLMLGVPMEKAIPTSLLVISILSLGGFLGELGKPIDWPFLLSVAAMALVGMVVGLQFRGRMNQKSLKLAFAYLVFAVAIWIFSKVI